MMEVVVEESEIMLAEKDKEVVKMVEEIKKVGVKVLREDKWEIGGEFVLKEDKVYVPKDKDVTTCNSELSQKMNLVYGLYKRTW